MCALKILKVTSLRRFEAVHGWDVLNNGHQGGLGQQNAVHVDPVDGIAEGDFLQTVLGVEEAACEQPTGSAPGRSPRSLFNLCAPCRPPWPGPPPRWGPRRPRKPSLWPSLSLAAHRKTNTQTHTTKFNNALRPIEILFLLAATQNAARRYF